MNRFKLAYAFVGATLISLLAQVSFNLSPVESLSIPITGQTLAVLTIAILSKREVGVMVIACYLLLGAIGLPVFANGSSGWAHLTGNSAGYLWSFLVVPYLIGKSENHDHSLTFKSSLIAQLMGTAFILLCGTLFLSLQVGLNTALRYGFYPFVAGGLIKSGIGAYIAWRLSTLKPFQSQ